MTEDHFVHLLSRLSNRAGVDSVVEMAGKPSVPASVALLRVTFVETTDGAEAVAGPEESGGLTHTSSYVNPLLMLRPSASASADTSDSCNQIEVCNVIIFTIAITVFITH